MMLALGSVSGGIGPAGERESILSSGNTNHYRRTVADIFCHFLLGTKKCWSKALGRWKGEGRGSLVRARGMIRYCYIRINIGGT